jgi:hypothetical protein
VFATAAAEEEEEEGEGEEVGRWRRVEKNYPGTNEKLKSLTNRP